MSGRKKEGHKKALEGARDEEECHKAEVKARNEVKCEVKCHEDDEDDTFGMRHAGRRCRKAGQKKQTQKKIPPEGAVASTA